MLTRMIKRRIERKHQKEMLAQYPACNYLNNAIRFALNGDTDAALREIVRAIQRADGWIHEPNQKALIERGICRKYLESGRMKTGEA